MEKDIAKSVKHMSNSQRELVRIAESQKHVAVHMAGLISEIPDENPFEGAIHTIMKHSSHLAKSVAAYLNTLAELEDALAINLELLIKDLAAEPDRDE